MTKKQLCGELSSRAADIYYAILEQADEWCVPPGQHQSPFPSSSKQARDAVFARFRLEPPDTYSTPAAACADLRALLKKMEPSWYARAKHAVKRGLNWLRRNPKALVAGAALLALLYFGAPHAIAAAQKYLPIAAEAAARYGQRAVSLGRRGIEGAAAYAPDLAPYREYGANLARRGAEVAADYGAYAATLGRRLIGSPIPQAIPTPEPAAGRFYLY
jgi:hypothetical protein